MKNLLKILPVRQECKYDLAGMCQNLKIWGVCEAMAAVPSDPPKSGGAPPAPPASDMPVLNKEFHQFLSLKSAVSNQEQVIMWRVR